MELPFLYCTVRITFQCEEMVKLIVLISLPELILMGGLVKLPLQSGQKHQILHIAYLGPELSCTCP